MAKGNLLLGMGRGKLGDVVLYRQNGQQMSRPRVRVVKNPRTSGQQIQRMIQATIAYAYAGLKTIVDHSFEGVQYGGKSMNYFMKRNMDALRSQVIAADNGVDISARFAAPNIRVLYPNEYVVSNGSLAPFAQPTGNIIDPTTLAPGLAFPYDFNANMTFGDFMSALGVSAGEQLTFLFFNVDKDGNDVVASINDEKAYATALAVRRFKFKDSYTQEELDTLMSGVAQENFEGFVDASVTSDDFEIHRDAQTSKLYVVVPSFKNKRIIYGGCCIRSRKNGESWLRSPQTVYISSDFLGGNKNPGFTVTTAYNAWMSGTTQIGVSEYILNGKPNTEVWPIIDDENP